MSGNFDPPLPRDKHDAENAAALVAAGGENIMHVMPQILEWMQDRNWPVARVFQPFLADVGARLAPFVKAVFATDDNVWKYNLLVGIVGRSPELATALRADLERMAYNPTAGEQLECVAVEAQDILTKLSA